MTFRYHPNSSYEKFGVTVYGALAENFPHTYFVGGMVRDMLLNRKITDIDIATGAKPQEVEKVLRQHGIVTDARDAHYGIIRAKQGRGTVEIATFRRDLPASTRYPEVRFINTPKADSLRRDFTINGLYYDYDAERIYDFHHGLSDLKKRQLKFIGPAARRVKEDPLRLIRAIRFQKQLKFSAEKKTAAAIKKYFPLVKKLSAARIETEINKLATLAQRKTLRRIINSLPLDAK